MQKKEGYLYDVFLSHHSDDKPWVEELARRLLDAGVKPFLDAWHLVPGRLWQKELESALATSRTCAVIVGRSGLGPWAEQEMLVAQERQVADSAFRVIPVLLPGAYKPDLPRLLRQRAWVEFISDKPQDEDALRRLVAGIRDQAPGPSQSICETALTTDAAIDRQGLRPNPFGDQGRITDPQRFFDREWILERIFTDLAAGHNLSLVGETQIGKSSVLAQITRLGPERLKRGAKDFVYLDMQTLRDDDDFFGALSEELGLPACQGWKLKRALRERRVILSLDEIEKMTYAGFSHEVRAQIRGLADGSAAPLTLVVASREPLIRLFPDSAGETSPLAHICSEIRLRPFPTRVARTFLRQRMAAYGLRFDAAEESRIITESGGNPGLLQELAGNLFQRESEKQG